MKTSLLSAFYFSPKKKKKSTYTNPFSESLCDSVVCSSTDFLQSADAESVHMGIIKTNNALLLIPHILLKSS